MRRAQAGDLRARLAAIVESSNDAIVAKDLDGTVTAWNGAAERLFGYRAEEIIGQPITVIFPPELVPDERNILGRIASGQKIDSYETRRVRKDGSSIMVSVTVSPIRDAKGTIVGASKIARDLTERDIRERRISELQAELVHVQRLNEMGQVVSTLVHEVNQPLTAIANYINACRRLANAGNEAAVQTALQRVADQTTRAREIVQRIRDFVKKSDLQMRREDLPAVIEDAIALTRASVRDEGVVLRTRFDPSATTVHIDRVQVQQVIFNLVRNGIEAMHQKPDSSVSIATSRTDGDMVKVSIADNGPGLPDEVREKLFQPFVTTKPTGMGVGLSVCHAIVEAHGGRIWADDNPAGGAVFHFTVRATA